jgi:hypothetical protein
MPAVQPALSSCNRRTVCSERGCGRHAASGTMLAVGQPVCEAASPRRWRSTPCKIIVLVHTGLCSFRIAGGENVTLLCRRHGRRRRVGVLLAGRTLAHASREAVCAGTQARLVRHAFCTAQSFDMRLHRKNAQKDARCAGTNAMKKLFCCTAGISRALH